MTHRREYVDLHSFEPTEQGWELRIYQSSQVLILPPEQDEIARSIEEAKDAPGALELGWDEDSGIVHYATFTKS